MDKVQERYEESELYRIRHSAAHVMAQAVLEMFPGQAKIAIGPPIENGFYYDFELPRALTPEDLERIEARMREILRGEHAFERKELSADEARRLFANQPFKLELIDGLERGGVDEYGEETSEKPVISIYTHDSFTDLCRGPHVPSTKGIHPDAVKLLSVAGAYWRGDEKRPMLQRIYGTAWQTPEELQAHLAMLEEAKKRDHRKLGRELEIFIFDDEVGPGLPLWLPKGSVLIEELERLAKETELRAGYVRVRTPHLSKEDLFVHSGHLPYYAESMYPPMEMEGVRYYVKPMNCPMHHKIFASQPRSYRDLPLRLAEYGTCYRFEKSGELFGLMRVRSMQMNDAHIYCSEEQFEQEFLDVVKLYLEYFRIFGIEKYVMRFSTHHQKGLGKKYVDDVRLWLKTEDMVRRTMQHGNVPFVEVPDEAAFYGPKIDVQIWSATGREFSLATNQVDFAQPARFHLRFVNREGKEEMPLCIHRAPLGTHERTIGFLLEHYAGAFPLWLAPVQAVVIPIADRHVAYARSAAEKMRQAGLRAEVDEGMERMNAKIRRAQLQKVPYMLVVGDREQEQGAVSVRLRSEEDLGAMDLGAFIARAQAEAAERR
ncbi:MAG TPA: threonine--tRNA ligase [Anaerolineales bacterium]|nr:threonine--tRNA ligase [Anaerolineales bacterium]